MLTEADIADLDYAQLRYAINEMYARHGAQFFREPDIRKQFEQFNWYVPLPEMTLARIDREFSRIEKQNRDLLSRLRDQKRPK
jgi:YARHG domain